MNEQASSKQERIQGSTEQPKQMECGGVAQEAAHPTDAGDKREATPRKRRRKSEYLRVKSKTPVKQGDLVSLLIDDEVWHEGKVTLPLSKQFIVLVNGKERFYFYDDHGVTWKRTT